MYSTFLQQSPKRLLKSLQWRSALKTFKPIPSDDEKKVQESVETIVEGIRLAPSAFGIQPYYIHVITNKDMKLRLKEVRYLY